MSKPKSARLSARLPVGLCIAAALIVAAGAYFLLAPRSAATAISDDLYSEEQNVLASVFVPFARWNEALGAVQLTVIVTTRVDAEGVCTIVASRGSRSAIVSVDAIADASTMTCANVVLDPEQMDPGDWSIVVSYQSGDFTAVSDPVVVVVPQ